MISRRRTSGSGPTDGVYGIKRPSIDSDAPTMQVRTIQADELVAWVEAIHVPFYNRPATDEAEFRRPHIDLDRAWAAIDGERIVGTLSSFATELTLPGQAGLVADAVTNVGVN